MQQSSPDSAHCTWTLLQKLATDENVSASIAKLSEDTRRPLIEAALAQGMGPALAAAFANAHCPLSPQLRDGNEAARFMRAAAPDVLRHIASVFRDQHIDWAVFKGPVLASHYADPSLRAYKDLDVLVRGRDLERAIDALAAAGIDDINRNWLNYQKHGVAETPMWAPGTAIDVHWHLVGLAERRRRVTLDIDALLDRVRFADIDGVELPTMSCEDQLLHVALHAALSGATMLLWLRDIREILESETPDWDRFTAMAMSTDMAPQIGQTIDRARSVLGARVPPTVCRALCPEVLLRFRRRFDLRNCGANLPDRFLRGFPVAASGSGFARTAALTFAIAARRLRTEPDWNVGSVDGPLYWDLETGGPNARRDYMDYARRHG